MVAASLILPSCAGHKETGQRDAERDFKKGIMQLETYGLRMAENPYDEYLLSQGIKQKTVAGCIVDDEIIKHAAGYNETMKQLINRKLGKDIFKEAEEFAEKKRPAEAE